MAIKPVQNTMDLGVVFINNRPCLAILYFKTPEDVPRAITDEIQRTQKVAFDLFQKVVEAQPELNSSLIERVDAKGFHGPHEINHNDASTRAWQQFVAYLENPTLVGSGTEVEITDLSELARVDLQKFAGDLTTKLRNAQENNAAFPVLEKRERLFLERLGHFPYPKLLAGQFDMKEIDNLYSEKTLVQCTIPAMPNS